MRRRLFRPVEAVSDGLDVGALAPMVDMMTLLLVFLLRTWSTESAPEPSTGSFELATTTSTEARSGGLTVLVSPSGVWLEGRRVIGLDDLGDDTLIRPLYDPLLAMRGEKAVEIHADATVPWAVLKRVFATCQAAGSPQIALVGVSAESL